MRLGPVAVRDDPRDFGLEQGDTGVEFVARKRVERFGGQLTGQIPLWARALVEFHCNAQCGAFVLAVNPARGYRG